LKNIFFSKERFGTFGHTTKRNILGDFEQNQGGHYKIVSKWHGMTHR